MTREPLAPLSTKTDTRVEARPWLSRTLWFIGLWLASVTVLSAVALLIRFWIKP